MLLPLDEVVVTANTLPTGKMRASVSVSTLDAIEIGQSASVNAADLLRDIPGVYAQASGGEGNANVALRGLPISGGAKLAQFQEDGLPVLDFGDIDFATSDTFVRVDGMVDRLEAIRGGSASTFASNAPGGVFNFISKTGETAGGHIAWTQGLGFERKRLDFDYGQPLDGRWRYEAGGYYRVGAGPRTVGVDTAEDGGQVRANVTRQFDRGYVRLYAKVLDERTPVYLPVPVSLTGPLSDPHVASLPGFDVLTGALQSPYFLQDSAVDAAGQVVHTDLRDGYFSSSRAFGLEASAEIGGHWSVTDRFRHAAISGRFVGPYPGEVNTAAALAQEIGGSGATLSYASGPLAGQAIGAPGALAGNGLAVRTLLFNVSLNDLGNVSNDLQLKRGWRTEDGGSFDLSLGYFRSQQRLDEDWHWNSYLEEVAGSGAALLNVSNAQGQMLTQAGLVNYGEPLFGNCCVRDYRLRYDTSAPYAALDWQDGRWNLDASARYDVASAAGTYAGSSGTRAIDVNGNGVIEFPERTVPVVDPATVMPVGYTVHYLSYSAGANWLVDPDLALFARTSLGGRANAERMLFGGGIRRDGSIAQQIDVNPVRQSEGGMKWRQAKASMFLTAFHSTTQIADQDITSVTERYTSRVYEANGLELDGQAESRSWRVRAGLTYTVAHIASDHITPQDVGAQSFPHVLYQASPQWHGARGEAGVVVLGTSAVPSNNGGFTVPRFVQTNAFVRASLTGRLSLVLESNNVFNRIGITEIDNGGAAPASASGVQTARSIVGRSTWTTLTYAMP